MMVYLEEKQDITRFFLSHVVFDEEAGPVLKDYKSHGLEIPRIILQGVTTTLFTMAVGVGEPIGESDTAIIPINVTGMQGRVLIHSFTVKDQKARGKNRIESFMLFIPKSHQDNILQHSLAISNILNEAIKTIREDKDETFTIDGVFDNIKKLLLTEIDVSSQNTISQICTDDETAIVSNGQLKAFHNLVLTPELVSMIKIFHNLFYLYENSLKKIGTNFDVLPIEFHGKTKDNQQFYLISIDNNIIFAYSYRKGRLGSMIRSFREVLWNISMKSISKEDYSFSDFPISIIKKEDLKPINKQYIDFTHSIIKNFNPIIFNSSIIKARANSAEILSFTEEEITTKHGYIAQLFMRINELTKKLFRTSLNQLVISQHDVNTIVSQWDISNDQKSSLLLIGDSNKDVGLLKVVTQNLQEIRSRINTE